MCWGLSATARLPAILLRCHSLHLPGQYACIVRHSQVGIVSSLYMILPMSTYYQAL